MRSERNRAAAPEDGRAPEPDWPSACAAVIPCFNEAGAIREVVSQARIHLPAVIVVDDGSTDDTASLAAAAGAEVIRHARNRGKGAALRTGFEHARSRGFTWGLTLDGDGQHAPADIPRFFARAEHTHAPLVVGNRLGEPEKIPFVRRAVNRWMTARLSRLADVPLADSQCGFRLIHLETAARLPLKMEHFETESELLIEFARARRRIEFVPVQVIYKTRASKISPVLDTWRWYRWWFAVTSAPRVPHASRRTATPSPAPIPPLAPAAAVRPVENRA